MRQAVVKRGKVLGAKVSAPVVSRGCVLIKVVSSCISAGTEMHGVRSSGGSLIKKALNQPEKVKRALDIAKKDGYLNAYKKAKNKVEEEKPTGYSISGIIIEIGECVTKFSVGDKVAAAGAGIANHAEYVSVPENLVMNMPENLSFDQASSVTLGGIAMQGVRRGNYCLGEFCVVFGAGILGLLSVQILKASGVRVAAIDLDEDRLNIAKELGVELVINPKHSNALNNINEWTGGYGADGVLFTAATHSNEPLSDAFKMCKKKGRVVLVGVSGMEIQREDIYPKELDFLVSTSYGPGRYDTNYEDKGLDYPYSYVRWTENRNMQEYLRLLSEGNISVELLIQKKYPFEKVTEAFESFNSEDSKPLMVLLNYGELEGGYRYHSLSRVIELNNNPRVDKESINVAIIGAGKFATGVHIPNMLKLGNKFNLYALVNRSGLKAKNIGKEYNFSKVSTDIDDILNDNNVDLVFITSRHGDHGKLVLKSLQAGKNVFVEKPLAISNEELAVIESFYQSEMPEKKPLLMVGFNRRFSKYAREIKKHTDSRINPLFIQYRMNAGFMPRDHWTHEDGGRIIGEGCHIIDLMTYLTGAKIESISVEQLSPNNDKVQSTDNKSFTLKYSDGSVCNIQYFSTGSKALSKEYMEVHFDEKSIILNDYKSLEGFSVKVKDLSSNESDKGHLEELQELHKALIEHDHRFPIELWDMFQTTQASFLV